MVARARVRGRLKLVAHKRRVSTWWSCTDVDRLDPSKEVWDQQVCIESRDQRPLLYNIVSIGESIELLTATMDE